ncbi:PAS/PAC sensor hybrid histidine kinase [Sporomusa malonica]|uniref:Circadian input-output histidine kinase CikA n=2 Tax=Sporomusa malonica TaxID=112901 RepID=A0A1W2DKC9_9FIRM|nr:PAS/PAC sensor hybrid histidine kinase [Sporomusa malonica]
MKVRVTRKMVRNFLNNNQLILALSSIGDGVIVSDLLANVVYINQHAETIIGQKSDEVIGRDFDEVCSIIHCETRLPMRSRILEVIRTNTALGFEKHASILRNGELVYVSSTCSPFVDTTGKTIGTITILRDITRFKKWELHCVNEEKNLRNIFNSTPVGMVLLDSSFKITDINKTALNVSNKSKSEALGECFGNALRCANSTNQCGGSPDCQSCEINFAIRRSYQFNVPVDNIECQKTLKRGDEKKLIWLKIGATPVIINGERNVVVTIVNITDEKERELTVAEARDFYFSMFEGIPAIVWRTGMQQEYLYLNDYWTDFTGRKLEEGALFRWLEFVHPDDRKAYFDASLQALLKSETYQSEIRMLHKSGEYRWLYCINRPFYDLAGNTTGFIGMGLDINDRKTAEKSLTRYKTLLEKARDIILFVGMDGHIIDANDAAVQAYGYSREELLSCTVWDIRQLKDSITKQMLAAYREGAFFETMHRRKDGTIFPVEVSSKGTMIGDQEVLLSIIRDITERKIAEQELKAAKEAAEAGSRAKGEFLANMSHEIRTPINGIVGMIDLTLMTGLDNEQQENLITAKSCANSLVGIINDILDFSKIEAGKLHIDSINFCPKDIVEETIRAHAIKAAEKNIDLNYMFASTIPPVLIGDPNRLRQVLNNLISNAIKFTRTGEITVSTKRSLVDNGEVELLFSVTDTGIGISPEDISKLFEPFSQVDGSITRKFGGTGLGLAISKQLVEMMHGSIGVKSQVGEGTSFFFTIQCGIGDKIQERQKPVTASYKTLFPKRILLAEDNIVNQDVIMRLLKQIGHYVEVANHGLEVLDLLERNQNQFDLILMDIQMPHMDGLEVTTLIRARETVMGGHMPIIALTAHALYGDKERFIDLGMDGYLAKPTSILALAQEIDGIWRKDGQLEELNDLKVNEQGEFYSVKTTKQTSRIDKLSLAELSYRVEQFRLSLERVDIPAIEEYAHRLKDEFNKMGIDELKNLAFKVELAARRENLQQITEVGTQLLDNFSTLVRTYHYAKEE